jgi:hypothetical protein
LQRAQIEIGARHVGNQSNQHDITGGYCRVNIVLRRLDCATIFAENVDLPGCIEADEIDYLPDASGVFGGP